MDIFRGNTIYLRLMEPQDYETTYPWRNDYNIQKMTCGPLRFISEEMEKNWAQNRSLDNTHDIYLAVCSIEDNKMIGYTSINDINYINRSCDIGGIVIGDKSSRDGNEITEVYLLLLSYVFDQLNMNRTYGHFLEEHTMTAINVKTYFYEIEGCERQAVYKDGKYHDVILVGLLREDYYRHKEAGDYDFEVTIKRLLRNVREVKKKLRNK